MLMCRETGEIIMLMKISIKLLGEGIFPTTIKHEGNERA